MPVLPSAVPRLAASHAASAEALTLRDLSPGYLHGQVAQQVLVLLLQQLVAQATLPQHSCPALAQNFVPLVPVQHCWPALQPTLPQQNPPEGEQKVVPLELVQQAVPALQ